MTKPRWIDAGLFRILRTATKSRKLVLIVGPLHGDAPISTRAAMKAAALSADSPGLEGDARLHSGPDTGLQAAFALRQPGFVTTAVANAVGVSAPEGGPALRLFGPDSKGLKGAWERKEPFLVRLAGGADDPASLVLTSKERKALIAPDSRYQNFLRTAFTRTVLFSGYRLDDPDLVELLEDVRRCYNGHVPANIGLVPAGATDPAIALRASMHFGMSIVEFPADMSHAEALRELASLLEELEIPKPATGHPPPGFTELGEDFRRAVSEQARAIEDFDRGDSSSWAPIKSGADAPRSEAGGVREFLTAPTDAGRVRIAFVEGEPGQGKTTLLRRIAWDLAGEGRRVFWRESGSVLPDRYVPAGAENAMAIFVLDDAWELANLPALLDQLASEGAGKARFLIAADREQWERSGLDHRIPRSAEVLQLKLAQPDGPEAEAMLARLASRGRLRPGTKIEDFVDGEDVLLERLACAQGHAQLAGMVSSCWDALQGRPDADRLRRAWLATAMVHRHGLSMSRAHLSQLVHVAPAQLDELVVQPLSGQLVPAGAQALRTPHPVVAAAVCAVLSPDEAARHELATELLASLPGGSTADASVFHLPSEFIRALRHGPLAPLTLNRFFEASENAARNDVLYWFDRGRFDADFSRWKAALDHFDRALWRQPAAHAEKEHNAAVQACRARCLQNLGRKRDALLAVDEGLRLMHRDATLLGLRDKLGGRREQPRGPRRGERSDAAAPGGPRGAGGGRSARAPRGGRR